MEMVRRQAKSALPCYTDSAVSQRQRRKKVKLIISLCSFALLVACQSKTASRQEAPAKKSAEDLYHEAQEKIFKQKSEELASAGRIPAGFDAYMYMSQYGWHSERQFSVGTSPIFSDGGSFGAYTFYQPAYEQAKKIWIFSGFMLPGSDLLWIKDRGIKFDKSAIGRTIAHLFPEGCYADNGNDPCETAFRNPDFSGATPGEMTDAKVIDVFGHTFSWRSLTDNAHGEEYREGPLRLNKKASVFVSAYDVELKPDGYVDMCACTIPTNIISSSEAAAPKECVQGATLMPGESCSISFGVIGGKK